MVQQLFIGVDGGATKVSIRVEDENGVLLGKERGGPASLRHSVSQAWQSIHMVLTKILRPLHISFQDNQYRFHAGMGLAGCELHEAYQSFLNQPHPFDTLLVSSDAYTACLGAHNGEEGAVIIAGTGVVGFQWELEKTAQVSGWGFPHDDEGGGAWLGLHAVKLTFKWLDKRAPASLLAKTIYAHFNEDLLTLVTWANQANATAFAELAPIVFECAKANDKTAMALLQKAASSIDEVGEALIASQAKDRLLPCALVGGISIFIQPYLSEKLRSRLSPCIAAPDAGAILLVRKYLAEKQSVANQGRV